MTFFSLLLTILFESDNGFIILAAGPCAAIGFYSMIYFYYRNTNKSYQFEETTLVTTSQWKAKDRKVGEVKRTKVKEMRSRNDKKHRIRVERC